MTYPHIQEAFASAMEPAEITYSNDIYGQIEFDVWFCALKKGVGKQVYDPQMHKPGERRTAITVNLSDIGGNSYKREFIAEIPTDGWVGVVLPSLKALGVTDLMAFNNSYVHAEMVKVGTYKKTDGTEGVRTAPKILAVYKTREECENAAQGGATQADWMTGAPPPAATNGNATNGAGTAGNDAERAVAVAFLPAIVKSAIRGNGVDLPALEAALKSNPILARYFTVASPEVTQAMATALQEPAF